MKSFNDVDTWVRQIKTCSGKDTKIFLVGNKADLEEERVISKEQGLEMKEILGCDFFIETSSKTGFNVQKMFVEAGLILCEEHLKIDLKPKIFAKLNKYIDF